MSKCAYVSCFLLFSDQNIYIYSVQDLRPSYQHNQALNISTNQSILAWILTILVWLLYHLTLPRSFAQCSLLPVLQLNANLFFRLVFTILVMDKNKHTNDIHHCILESKRITRNVFAGRLLAIIHGFIVWSTMCSAFNSVLECTLSFHVYTDSRSQSDCLKKVFRTPEKGLLIDSRIRCQFYEDRKITEAFWIVDRRSSAESSANPEPCEALQSILSRNKKSWDPMLELNSSNRCTLSSTKTKALDCIDWDW